MNLAALRTEFRARGFEYLYDGATTRIDYYLNAGYHELCERHPWPFLETTATGASPLTIADVRQVLSVTDTTDDSELWGIDRRELVSQDPSVNDAGAPTCWYFANNVITTWPTTSVSLSVNYLKVPADLSGTTDTPVVPARYHLLIIDGASIRAYRDSDNFESAQALRQSWEDEVLAMAANLLHRNYQNNGQVIQTGSIVSDYNA